MSKKRRSGGSVPGHKTINRQRMATDIILRNDYFIPRLLYNEEHFCRRFRMRRSLFLRTVHRLTSMNIFFKQRRNTAGVIGFSPLQKCIVATKMLAYGGPADSLDDGQRTVESTMLKTLQEFVTTTILEFGDEFLRPPIESEL